MVVFLTYRSNDMYWNEFMSNDTCTLQQSGERVRIPYEISLVVVYVYIFIDKH